MRGVAGVQDLLGLTIAAVPLGGRRPYPACGTPRSADRAGPQLHARWRTQRPTTRPREPLDELLRGVLPFVVAHDQVNLPRIALRPKLRRSGEEVADGVICAQPRVTVSPRWTRPVRRTSPYTPTWTSLWRAAVRRIPLSLGRSPCGSVVYDAARAVVGDLEHDVVADPKFSPHPFALHELGVIVLGTHDDVGSEAPDLEAALRVELS